MDAQQQVQPPQPQKYKRPHWVIIIAVFIILLILCLVAGTVIAVLNLLSIIHMTWSNNVSIILLTVFVPVLTVLIPLLQWFLSLPFYITEVLPTPIIVQFSTTTPTPPTPLSLPTATSKFRDIQGHPPLFDSRTIQQREQTVKDIYGKLVQPDISTIALTGIGGVGKSTLAALVYRYVEEQRRTGKSPFTAPSLWLRIDPSVTMVGILGNLCDALNIPLPDVSSLSPQNQAMTLFNLLNNIDKPRLIVLDQFENVLSEDGQALPDRPGIGEWLDALNSQPCACRVLLTSRPVPQGMYNYPSTYLQPYQVEGLSKAEGIELLRKWNVNATDAEMRVAIKYCDGHALSLTLLASLLQKRNLLLGTLLNDPHYTQLWAGKIAHRLLDTIYMEQLDTLQRMLLAAFSVYREPVLLDAAQAILEGTTRIETSQSDTALDGLLTQHLLQATGEGLYQPHAIVAEYAQGHLVEGNAHDQQTNRQILLAAHDKAAQYYLQRAATTCPQRENRQQISDVHDLIEAVWQYCQAELWPEAYDVMDKEGIFDDLKSWGGNATLLELYELLLPLDKWHTAPDDHQAVYIYNNLGRVCSDLENKRQALEYYNRALELSVKLDNSIEQTRTLNNLGWIYSELENKKQAQEYFERALKLSRKIGDYKREASTLNGFGRLYNGQGKKEQARAYYEQALKIYREHKERETLKGKGWTLNNLGKIYAALENWEQALNSLNEALTIRRDTLKNQWETGRTLRNLGETYLASGQIQEALERILEALRIAKEVGDLRGEGRALDGLGQVRQALGERELALDCFQKALHLHKEMKDRRHEAKTLGNLGSYYAVLTGQQDQTRKNCVSALSIYMELGDRWGEAVMLQMIGTLYFQQDRYKSALACFLDAQNIFEVVQSPKYKEAQKIIDDLQKKIGDDQFIALLAEVEPQINQIVGQELSEGVV